MKGTNEMIGSFLRFSLIASSVFISSCTMAKINSDTNKDNYFSDHDKIVSAKICRDIGGKITVFPNKILYPNIHPYNISSDIWSMQYMTTVSPIGGLNFEECKRLPAWDTIAYWSDDDLLVMNNSKMPGENIVYPINSPENIKLYQKILDDYDLKKRGDSSGMINGKRFPRQGY